MEKRVLRYKLLRKNPSVLCARFFKNGILQATKVLSFIYVAPHVCIGPDFFQMAPRTVVASIFFSNGSMHGCIGPEFFQMALCKVLWFLIAKFSILMVSRHTEKFPFLLRCNLFECRSNAVRIQFFACSELTISCTVLISAIIKACY